MSGICVCEIANKYSNSYSCRMDILNELVRRQILAVEKVCHMTFTTRIGNLGNVMAICFCEIQKRWEENFQAMVDMVEECEKKSLLTSTLIKQHNTYERVWKPLVWREIKRDV